MWRQIYESSWHHPVSFIAINALVLGAVVFSKSALRAFLLVFTAEILLDATLTAKGAPIPASWGPYIGIPFVILGDARALILVERIRRLQRASEWKSDRPTRATLAGLAMAFVVPVLQTVLLKSMPAVFADSRKLFLAYEVLFFVGWSAYFALVVRPSLARIEPSLARWARAIYLFVAAQYALWATSDVSILQGLDAGYALRLVPNTLYYALFLPFVWRSAPPEVRAP
ncbi:MAG: hypothetical protein JNK05_23300 [Myxococcales bacterium]|nr:hypothetical protein [Myxococcales bacterium]